TEVLRGLGKKGVKRLDVFCPGFVSDCLETLEEIALEGRQSFLDSGGGELQYIPALNDLPEWIKALGEIAWRELGGWLNAPPDDAAREASRGRARSLGAKE
ncbi:MAG: ferrochelatase, partial [Betaproteobacteria bacterium]|nr:ferrochelatase [Betaproteobacteria bacterium]